MESKPLKLFGFLQDQTYSVDCAGYLKEGEEEGEVTLKERVPGEGEKDGGKEAWLHCSTPRERSRPKEKEKARLMPS